MRETRGDLKVFEDNGHIVGAYIVGPHAGELIAEAALSVLQLPKTFQRFYLLFCHLI